MNEEKLRPADKIAEENRYIITQMIEGMTDAQLDKALTLLRRWLLEEDS